LLCQETPQSSVLFFGKPKIPSYLYKQL
jgi:hypothetical protein